MSRKKWNKSMKVTHAHLKYYSNLYVFVPVLLIRHVLKCRQRSENKPRIIVNGFWIITQLICLNLCFRVSLVTWICIGVLFSMVFLGTVFLIVACLSTGKMSRRVFNSRKKNVCARVLNGTVSRSLTSCQSQHTEAESKWLKLRRRHFQTYFLQWKCLHFD